MVLLAVSWPAGVQGQGREGAEPPALHGRAAAVADAATGRILWEQDGRRPLPMASLTKIMTALVALERERDQLDVPMVVPPDVTRVYGERIYLEPGETYTFGDLLTAMLVASANDAAVAIAVNVAGSVPAFVDLMNQRAAELGLADTHFENPHGLDEAGHYASADDLASLASVAMRDPIFRRVVSMKTATVPWPARHGERVLTNHNYLLGSFPGATGVKIGYTSRALNCVVGSATRGGREVIAVVMGETPRWEWRDESALLQFGLALAQTLPPPPARGEAPVQAGPTPAAAAASAQRPPGPRDGGGGGQLARVGAVALLVLTAGLSAWVRARRRSAAGTGRLGMSD
jgi:D-alanyl-D-alanine carboxypeptidase (penicillin-binding protein 5/6)